MYVEMNLAIENKIVRKKMPNDQMKKYIPIQVTRSGLSLFSRSTYSTITAIIISCVYMIMIIPTVHAQDVPPPASEEETTEYVVSDAGMEAAAALSTIVYFPFKAAFALGGGIVGGLTYAFTGGDEEAANKVWRASMEGTYNITPENLTGEKPVHFVGPTE